MTEIIKAQCRKITYLGIDGGERLTLLVDKLPEFTYKRLRFGNFYYGESDGFASILEHRRGTTRGCGGRTITLNMEDGSKREFKGSLWSPFKNPDTVPELWPASVTTDAEDMERGHTFYGYEILATKGRELLDELGIGR